MNKEKTLNEYSKIDCPEMFCFFWSEENSYKAEGIFDDIDDALENLESITESGCGCSFGICTRKDKDKGDHDWYEPFEPKLDAAGLPWDYFMPEKTV